MPVDRPAPTFINIANPNDAKGASKRLAVRSHVARYQWRKHFEDRGSESAPVRSKRRREEFLPLRIELDCSLLDRNRKTGIDGEDWEGSSSSSSTPPIPRILGGGRVDPFRSYPVAWRPFMPAIVDHYLISMAVDIPELDQPGNAGLLRTRWFPLVMTEPAPFLVILLIAASNYASLYGGCDMKTDLLQLRCEAIRTINEALREPERALTDAVIGAVAKMASYEAMFGSLDTYNTHMMGLVQMVDLRGGLASLGLDGLLRRICIWIDRNSAFLNGAPLYFPNDTFVLGEPLPGPNPGHFLGAT
ncbi:transcriptional regulator family: Fungal Specific TF [Paecilomyces variotii]|nr:transcriptional regulator family: Fungal Specific TF [Paecilomyces variotii]